MPRSHRAGRRSSASARPGSRPGRRVRRRRPRAASRRGRPRGRTVATRPRARACSPASCTSSMICSRVWDPYVCGSRRPSAPRFGPNRNSTFMPSLPSRATSPGARPRARRRRPRGRPPLAAARSRTPPRNFLSRRNAASTASARRQGPVGLEAERGQQPTRPRRQAGRRQAAPLREPGREHHADRHGLAVGPPRERVEPLERVAERVPVVQDQPSAGVALVARPPCGPSPRRTGRPAPRAPRDRGASTGPGSRSSMAEQLRGRA